MLRCACGLILCTFECTIVLSEAYSQPPGQECQSDNFCSSHGRGLQTFWPALFRERLEWLWGSCAPTATLPIAVREFTVIKAKQYRIADRAIQDCRLNNAIRWETQTFISCAVRNKKEWDSTVTRFCAPVCSMQKPPSWMVWDSRTSHYRGYFPGKETVF